MAARRHGVGLDAHSEVGVEQVDARDVSGASAFAWQEGYSVFSVSKSQEDALKRYIKGQAAHHKTEDFKSELLRILRAHSVEFDEKYVFD